MIQTVLPLLLTPATAALVLAYLRVQACVLALPVLSERSVTVRVRVALAMALTPLFADATAVPEVWGGPWAFAGAAVVETLIGLVLGLFVRLVSMALTMAASAIAAAASLSQLFGADTEMAPHPIGNLVHLAGLAVLMALGFPIFVVDYLGDAFALWPPGTLPDAGRVADHAVDLVSRAFALAIILASPFVLGGFLFQALSGVVNRVMPAFPVVFVGAPAAILLALGALTALTAPIISVWADAVLAVAVPDIRP